MLTDRIALVTSKNAINVPGEYTVSIDADKTIDKAGNHLQESFEGTIEMTRINLDVMDLASSKTNVVQGETFTVNWKTFNQEEADLYGRWTDGVYLSKDDIWDNSDTLLASVVHYNGLPQGSSVEGQTQVALSGVVDGDYHLLVRPDIYNEKPTGASERNVQSIAVSVSTNALPDGAQTIHSGQSSTYKFTAEAGASYQLTLDTLRDDYSGMELYIGYGYSPTRENYDTAVRNANDAQLALAAQNYDQDIYVMVYAKNGYGNYTLTAEKVGLGITAVTPNIQGVLDGQALTFVVEGLCFTPETTVAAVNANEAATNGVVTYINDHQLLLTFEAGQLTEGDYVLKAVDGNASALSETITLTADGAPNLEVTADLPLWIGNHFITSFDVNYANTGNARRALKRIVQEFAEVGIGHVVVLDRQPVASLQGYVIRRVNEVQNGLVLAHELCRVGGIRAVAAHQPMFAELVNLAANADRHLRGFRHSVRLRLSGRHLLVGIAVEELVEFIRVEAQEGQVEVRVLQVFDLEREQVVIPFRELPGLVVGDAICLDLFGGEVVGNDDRDFRKTEALGRL